MRTLVSLGALVVLGSCQTAPTQIVSIRPIYTYADAGGCQPVTIEGSGLPTDASGLKASFSGEAFGGGSADLTDLAMPAYDNGTSKWLQNAGYDFTAVVPNAQVTTGAYADLTVTSNGTKMTIPQAFYYVACPGSAHVDAAQDQTTATAAGPGQSYTCGGQLGVTVTAGDVIEVVGCGFDPSTMTVVVGTSQAEPLTSACGTVDVTFAAPELPDGAYPVSILDGAGATLYPTTPCSTDTNDTAVTGDGLVLQYGSAS